MPPKGRNNEITVQCGDNHSTREGEEEGAEGGRGRVGVGFIPFSLVFFTFGRFEDRCFFIFVRR